MKNVVISGLVIGALACPVAFAHESAAYERKEEQSEHAHKHHGKHHKKHHGKHHAKKKHPMDSKKMPKETSEMKEIKSETDKAEVNN